MQALSDSKIVANYLQYSAPIGITIKYNSVNEFMQEWYKRYVEYHENEITRDQYINWKLNWPNSCDNTRDGHVDWKSL